MGFTAWPADLTLEGFLTAQNFAHEHGDIVSVMFIGGLPWPEALAGTEFSEDVDGNLSYRPPSGKKLFLSISPLNKDRSDLAPYWGEKDNLPLPAPWNRRKLNGPEVKKAFLAFTLRAVKTMNPDYLAIGIESNVLLSKNPAKWEQLKAFNLTLRGSQADQRQWVELLLATATRDRYEFVIQFATTDFERLCDKLPPPVDDLARIWAYTGMQTSDKEPKSALTVWDAHLHRRFVRAKPDRA